MEEKERFEFGQRTLFDSGEEVTTFDGFNLDDFMQIICSLLNKQSNRIKDLELLLNADKKIETNSLNGFEKLRQENQQLKQQLAEKDKQIDYYQSLLKRSCDECNIKLKTIKTNFALEQLEKVKEKALHFYVNDAPELTSFYVDVKEIDNQIKSLKGEE